MMLMGLPRLSVMSLLMGSTVMSAFVLMGQRSNAAIIVDVLIFIIFLPSWCCATCNIGLY